MTAGSAYFYQVQACNVTLIIMGFTAVGLAASQFWIASFNSYRKIDLRLLNWIHILAGLVGLYTLSRSYGTFVAKTVYCASIAVAIYSAAFYCATLFRILHLRNALMQEEVSPQNEMQYNEVMENFTVKVVICSLMIFVPVVAFLAALLSAALLNRIIVVSQPNWPQYSHEHEDKKYRTYRSGLIALSAIKLSLALCAVAAAIYLEYEHHLVILTKQPSVLIALDQIVAIALLLTVISAIVGMHSAIITSKTDYKVAVGISVIAAVWCLKSLDIVMYPYYYNDIRKWREMGIINRNGTQTLLPAVHDATDRNYLVFIIKSILVAVFALFFGLNLISAVQASKCFLYEYCTAADSMIQKSLSSQSRCLGLLHCVWGMLLMALTILGLLDVPWNANYTGADLMWLSVLLFATGVLHMTHSGSQLSVNFLLGFICFTCAVEKMCSSINLTYQSATHPTFLRGPEDVFIGRLLLHSVQLTILFLESLTGFFSVIIHGFALKQQYRHTVQFSSCTHVILLLGNMLYGIVLVGCNVVFTLGYWMFSESLVEIPFFQMGNGLLVFGISILQALSFCCPEMLPSVTILNVVSASIALFMISYAISNTYFLAMLLFAVKGIHWVITEVALIATACATISCVVSTFCSTFAVISYIYVYMVHRKPAVSTSTVVLCDESNYGTQQTLVSPQLQTAPVRHMEEQSIYWSAEENPYYYQTSKRYYDQPYKIESGYYGYALVNPQIFDSSHVAMGAGSNGSRLDSGRYFRSVSSSAAQTRIGHMFR